MIKAVIFDLDGLLIDSEPLWKQAETTVFADVGVLLTPDMAKETTGLRVDEVVEYWYSRFPWAAPSQKEIENRVVARLIQLVNESGLALAGVNEAIATVQKLGLPMGIASSSTVEIIDAVLAKLDIRQHMLVVHSAQHEPYGKPHPGVYLTAAEKMGVKPTECLAFEDSVNGTLAAKAAKMWCIAIPEPEQRNDPRFGIADLILDSLVDFTPEVWEKLA